MECLNLHFIGQPLWRPFQFFKVHGTPSFFAFYYIKGLHDLCIGTGAGNMKNVKYSFVPFLFFFRNGVHLKASFLHRRQDGGRGGGREEAFQEGEAGAAGRGFGKDFHLPVFLFQTLGDALLFQGHELQIAAGKEEEKGEKQEGSSVFPVISQLFPVHGLLLSGKW